MANDILELIMARHCKRAFLGKPVPREVLEAVLRAAAHAPSTRNNQPWGVAVLTGAAKEALSRALCEDHDRGLPPKLDYAHRPAGTSPLLEARAREAAVGLLRARGIDPGDEAGRRANHRDNFLFHGAPVELIFHLPANAVAMTFLELGFFIQNVMLGLVGRGMASCPQSSVAGYPDTIRRHLGFGPDRIIVCGMAVGYPDENAPMNRFVPERAGLEEYSQWFEHGLP